MALQDRVHHVDLVDLVDPVAPADHSRFRFLLNQQDHVHPVVLAAPSNRAHLADPADLVVLPVRWVQWGREPWTLHQDFLVVHVDLVVLPVRELWKPRQAYPVDPVDRVHLAHL